MKSIVDDIRYLLKDNPNFKTAYYQVINKEKLVICVEVEDASNVEGIPFEFKDEDVVVISNKNEKGN